MPDTASPPITFKEQLGRTVAHLLDTDPDVVYLDADLMSCSGTAACRQAHPGRAVNVGIAEANMIGVASGLAAAGFKPIAHSFAAFASRRCFDQVFLSAGYAGNPVTVLGTDPGVCASFNGGTHMPFEDMALYRAVPGATVLDVSDPAMLDSVLRQAVNRPGVHYIRTPRKSAAGLYAQGTDTPIGRAIPLRAGRDVTILASGIMVREALKAAEELSALGIEADVLDMFTVKPLDENALLASARRTGAVLTAENHSRIGGLYAAVCECLAQRLPVPAACVAVDDRFGEVGPQDYLQQRFGLTAGDIVRRAQALMARKG